MHMLQTPADLPDDQIEVWQQAVEYFHRAYQQQTSGDWASAISDYKRSIVLFPTAEAHTFLAWVYSFLHLYDAAIAECQRAIEVDPSFGNPYNDIGAYLIEQGKLLDAVPWLEKAILAPRYAARGHPWFNLGRIYEQQGDWPRAIDAYTRAVAAQGVYPPASRASQRLEARLN